MKKIIHIIFYLSLMMVSVSLLSTTAYSDPAKLKVGFVVGMPPYQFLDSNQNPVGVHIDILNAIIAETDIEIEYIAKQSKSECLDAYNKGQLDIVLGALLSDRTGYYGYTTSEISSSTLFMLASKEFLANNPHFSEGGHVAAFEYGTASYYLITSLGANRYIVSRNQEDVVESALNKGADLIIGVKDSILYQLKQKSVEDDYVIVHTNLDTISYGMVVREGDAVLLNFINSGIAALRASPDYEKILNKWIEQDDRSNWAVFIMQYLFIIVLIALAVVAYIIISYNVNKLLKKQVGKKTYELSRANMELEKRIHQIEMESNLRNKIVELSPSAIIIFNYEFKITFVNTAAKAMLYNETGLYGENLLETPVYGDIVKPLFKNVFEPGFFLENQKYTMTLDDESRTFTCSIVQISEYDQITGALLTVVDITGEEIEKQKSIEKEKNKALSRLVAGIAHEIRNPLMSIHTFASLIKTRGEEKEFQTDFAEFIPRETSRINKLVQGLIDYAKPVNGEIERVQISEIINNCLYLVNTMRKTNRISLETDIDSNLIIMANKNQIQQVIINIILNSLESIEEKIGLNPDIIPLKVRIEAFAKKSNAIIRITDQGMGMNKEKIKKCTEPFFTTKKSGTGLGLVLTKQYVEENGGVLTIESKEFEYTTIILTFRRVDK